MPNKNPENQDKNLNLSPLKEMIRSETGEPEEGAPEAEGAPEEPAMRERQDQAANRVDAQGQPIERSRPPAQERAKPGGVQGGGGIAPKVKSKVGRALIAGAGLSAFAGGGISIWSLFS